MNLSCLGALKLKLKSRKEKNVDSSTQTEEIPTNNVQLFSYKSMKSATENFHPSNRVGAGGFGVVYRGVLMDGTEVAVKSLSAESKQGTREFLTEIGIISNVRHPNLVQLIGCCIERSYRMLVYEYLENNSLASALLGANNKQIYLDWPKRAAICMGTVHGLLFLHEEAEPHIVHRDIKASNILLDKDLHPKIGDFGLAKLFPDNVTHLSTQVAGTMGYLAPEYALFGQLTKKADIYSLGVLLLEIVSGRSNTKAAFGENLTHLVEWTWKLKEEDKLLSIVDPDLIEFPDEEVVRFIRVALFCTQAAPHQRPSMTQVVEMLSKEVNLNVESLINPGVYKNSSSQTSGASSSQVSQAQKGKQSIDPFITSMSSTHLDSSLTISKMQPR
ncbi:putative serine/threonine-protein kinase isoform X2 [Macadamia integrifolia]|uniref:putative serine/threonine-protein kinase isoform X2 n=1 Tax=Macadamia integrifolia TaxID=60698 RepID=UPI001C4E3B4B|nr:putative serine/threonine-protein kinase isoform X2 [Macadamia integrifolia]